jgi:hypothetical protein
MSATELTALVLQLDESERSQLMDVLLDSFDAADPNDNDLDSASEAIARSQELGSGAVTPMSESDFWASVRADRGR